MSTESASVGTVIASRRVADLLFLRQPDAHDRLARRFLTGDPRLDRPLSDHIVGTPSRLARQPERCHD